MRFIQIYSIAEISNEIDGVEVTSRDLSLNSFPVAGWKKGMCQFATYLIAADVGYLLL